MPRLVQFLAQSGMASRRKAAECIKREEVTVNHAVVTDLSFMVDPSVHAVKCRGVRIVPEEKIYLAFNKPKGYVCTTHDPHNKETIMSFFKSFQCRLYPVGRLDKNTEGLLVLTNDGDFCLKMSHPRYSLPKMYEAVVQPPPDEVLLDKVSKGFVIDGYKTKPCRILMNQSIKDDKARICLELHEGRKRQIRRMFSHIGCGVLELKRTAIGGLKLEGIKPGEYIKLTQDMLKKHFGYEV